MSSTPKGSLELPAAGPQAGFNVLPQYGFGPDLSFASLALHNPFLFRVYSPKPLPPFFDSAEPFFIAPQFKNNVDCSLADLEPASDEPVAVYADVAQHLDPQLKQTSPYVSTSFSFAWAIWEATRRHHRKPNVELEIAIIDARALASRAVTTLEVLRAGDSKERHPKHWDWYQYASEAQDILIYGHVPASAVLSSIPLLSIIPKLPSFFVSSGSPSDDKHFNSLAWDFSAPRADFQQFCQQMSDQFMRSPNELRLRDTTAGAVHLAMGFLRPWFQRHALKEFHDAVHLVAEFAYIVARWPGQWWVREHPEIWDLIQAMVHVIGEEVRDAQRVNALNEVKRLEGVVSELQLLTEEYVYVHSRPNSSASSSDEMFDSDDEPTQAKSTHSVQTSPITPIMMTVPNVLLHGHGAPSKIEAVSCLLSSFFFGVFTALVVASGQQRDFVEFT